MKLHGNARTCPHSRALVMRRIERKGWALSAAAEACGVPKFGSTCGSTCKSPHSQCRS